MSEQSIEIFKQQILSAKKKGKIKTKKLPPLIIPTAYYRQYKKIIQNYLQKFIDVTERIFPLLEGWNKEVKQDAWEEELEKINEEQFEKIYNEEKDGLKKILLSMFIVIFGFHKKQWNKIVNKQFNFETFLYESWGNPLLNALVTRNVSLIKGLTDEYRKKIVDTITSGYSTGLTVTDIKSKLLKINNTFSNYRAELIAKDQINKINGQLTQYRQNDAGVTTYWWRTAKDERVRSSHRVMDGMLCRWDDATVYSDDMGKTWKSRASIGGVMLHPGVDINCRCYPEPNFEPLIKEINFTQENLVG